MDGLEDEARAFARVTTEADYAKAELAVARAQLRDLQDLSKQRFVSPLDIARLHAQVGNREEALALLERATDEDMTGLSLLKVDQAGLGARRPAVCGRRASDRHSLTVRTGRPARDPVVSSAG